MLQKMGGFDTQESKVNLHNEEMFEDRKLRHRD